MKVLITGGAGFIGHNLAFRMKANGYTVSVVDYKRPPSFRETCADEENYTCDLRLFSNAINAVHDAEIIFHLAADMGGMGFIGSKHSEIMLNNMLINRNIALALNKCKKVKKFFFSSSACVYPERLQDEHVEETPLLSEEMAWKGKPDTAYGVEKLAAEELFERSCGPFTKLSIARFHNIYGIGSIWQGGREKAPAALCRKVAVAKLTGKDEVVIWGDGQQVRSYCHISDCINMILDLVNDTEKHGPINIGSDEAVTINELVDMIERAAGTHVRRIYVPGPRGVAKRNADLTKIREISPMEHIPLIDGIADLYDWVESQVIHSMENDVEYWY